MKYWPQIILLILLIVNLGIAAAKNGLPKGDYSILTSLIDAVFILSILWWGGFFDGLIKALS